MEKPIKVVINGRVLDESEYTVNPYFGKITILNQQNLTPDMIKVDYYYLTSINSEHSIKGLGTQTYTQDQIQFRSLPIKYNGIQKITLYNPNEMILEENRDYTIDYYSNGTSFSDIHIRFILSDNSILSDTGYPSSSDTIKFDYLYTPNIDDTRAESKHTITDVQLRKEITPHWDIYTEIANSNYNFSKTANLTKKILQLPKIISTNFKKTHRRKLRNGIYQRVFSNKRYRLFH